MTKPKNGAKKRTCEETTSVGRQATYFLALSLENVRCFGPKQILDLSDGKGKPARWTIILGLNGTGKTTILQSLVGFELLPEPKPPLETQRWMPRLLGHFRDDPHSFWRRGDEPASWEVKLASSPILSATPEGEAEATLKMSPSSGAESLAMIGPNRPVFSPWCCAYGASRRMGASSLSESGSDDPTANLFSDKADLRNPEEWLLRLDYVASKPSHIQEKRKAQYEKVKKLLLSILPEGEVEDIRIASLSGIYPTPRVEFKTPYGWVPLRQLGYGYQTLITWAADLANRMVERYSNSPNPLNEPAVALVDEIDLHLHPTWQRKLMSFLNECFPNTQFIATAHSPLVAQAAADANLAVLRREGDHVIIDNDVDNIRGWRIDQILTSDLFGLESARPPQIERLLTERKALLTKPKLTQADRKKLEEIGAKIGDLPTGETAQEVKEREEIRKTLELMMKERQTSR